MREKPGILVTRPEPGGAETAAAVAALGWQPWPAPALVLSSILSPEWRAPACQAVLLPSRAAARALAGRLDPGLPVLAVGRGTAAEARAAGFLSIIEGEGDAASLAALAAGRLDPRRGALLLAAGQGYSLALAAALRGRGFAVQRRAVYAAIPAITLPPPTILALKAGIVRGALFLSPRSAQVTQALLRREGLGETVRGMVAFALSSRIAGRLADMPWQDIRATREPDPAALLALLGPAPHQASGQPGH
ncbi:uroporphyrinogen-III synthase [Roseomonas sp. 18066]|uniref:uroporphyrinogen-III synthase n=1 Tax=Roseomonas sp. 18066 TaxID=2681412 RepID=UPI00135B9D59|nr:uroporphyrinogen-III synthase [Roseomonas sp. 18066]